MVYKTENYRKYYKDLFECSLDLIYVHDLKGNFLDANDITLKCFGYSQEEFLNISIIDLIDDDQSVEFFNSLKEIKENGKFLNQRLYKIKKFDGKYIYIEVYGIPLIKNDTIYAILNIGTDITEHKIKEQKLKESGKNYNLLLENANDLISITNIKIEFEYINEEVHKKLLGYSNEDLIGKSALKFIHPDDLENVVEIGKKSLEIGEASGELRFRKKNGDYIWLDIRGKVFIDNDKQKGLVIARDITERKRIEQKLKESEEKYRVISENANDLIVILNSNLNIEYINESAHKKILDYSKEDLLGKFVGLLIHPDEIDQGQSLLLTAFDSGEYKREGRIKHKDGSWIWMDIKSKVIFDNEGNWKLLVISRNIDERKKAEQKLIESEEKYRLISENANDLIRVFSDNLEIEYLNEFAHKENLGYSKKELLGKFSGLLIHPDELEETLSNLIKAFDYGGSVRESRIRHKNGNWVWFEIKDRTFVDANGNRKLLAVFRNIDERKRAELKLKESEEKYRLITENANDLIRVLNDNLEMEYLNEFAHKEHLGYSKDELLGLFAGRIIHPDELEDTISSLIRAFDYGESIRESRIRHKNGNWIWFEVRNRKFIDEKGNRKMLAILRNIDKRKRAEQKLKESEKKYRNMINNLDLGFFKTDINGVILNHNPALNRILGFEPSESLVGLKAENFWINSKDLKDFSKTVIKTGSSRGIIHELKKKNGEKIILQLDLHIVENKEKNTIEFEGTVFDITEKYILEQRLKESERKFKDLFEFAPDSIYLLNFDGRFLDCNKAAEKLTGYKKANLIGRSIFKLPLISKEELSKSAEIFAKLKLGERFGPIELILNHKDGNQIPIEISSYIITLREKNVILGIARDITERKIAEQKLRESEEKYRLITENIAHDLIVILNDKLKVDYVNEDVLRKLWGYTGEEVIGKSALEFIHPDDHLIAIEALKKGFRNGQGELTELRLKDKMGNYVWFQALGNTFLTPKGETKVLIVCRDVDVQYRTEQKLIESERALKERVKELTCLYGLSQLVDNPSLSLKEIIQDTLDLILTACKFHKSTCARIIFENEQFETSDFRETKYELSKVIKVNEKELKIKLYRLEDKPFLKEEENLISDIGKRLKIIIEKKQAEENLRQFISTVSHELRNPITVLGQSLNNLNKYKDKLSEEMKTKLTDTLSRNIVLLTDLVEDLLIISRIDEERVKLIWKEYQPLKIIHEIIELMNLYQEEKEITIKVNVDKEIRLFGDSRRVSQIFRILIDNAIKYSGEKSNIIINATEHYEGKYNLQRIDGVLFQIKDFGIGISEEDLPHLFERFFRAKNVKNISGTGLGLCIAKELISLHNGEIYVESVYGKETTFSIFLPRLENY